MNGFEAAARILPPAVRRSAEALPDKDKGRCEEIRLRRGTVPSYLIAGCEYAPVSGMVTQEDLLYCLETATRASLHAAAPQLCRGFVSAVGGVRVGVCGTAVMGAKGMEGLRDISSLALRVPRQLRGCADGIWGALTEGGFCSTLIVSPPGAGKTTLLRELVRRLSDAGYRTGVADERGEIGDEESGARRFDVGSHTDIITGAPKAQAARMLIRAMNPQILAMDEITDGEDGAALLDAVGCGVALLATVHGGDAADAARRPACRELMAAGAFRRCVTVENQRGRRTYSVKELPCA